LRNDHLHGQDWYVTTLYDRNAFIVIGASFCLTPTDDSRFSSVGTLTANQMTVRALYTGSTNYLPDSPSITLGDFVKSSGIYEGLVLLIAQCVAIDTMNETVLYFKDGKSGRNVQSAVEGGSGNPTEVALLHMIQDMGHSYHEIRNNTKGRSDQGALGKFLSLGKQFEFSSARKIMSWAVPKEEGGYRLYCKGASEVVLARCNNFVASSGAVEVMTEDALSEAQSISLSYASRGMRCLALAYRDVPDGFSLDAKHPTIKNSDGLPANEIETCLTSIALVGIEDPLREDVPGAIAKCYKAGIDVRMVTGDNPNTAVSIAFQAGILRDFHFVSGTTEFVASNLKPNVLLEGKTFRSMVYTIAEDGTKSFDQSAFDKIWPFLRVMARSSPDDKLTLAHGLNQSLLYADKPLCAKLLSEHGIKIFPDRQVVAMTGDGTNDAPALKRSDIGFAMGIAGTQIAKDAADIILLDDNFASIVTAAKWGRNIYASIQKFLQFQLNVNIVAVTTALVGAFVYQQSPLAAIQLLWVNLLMDSLASLALASEPPVEELLEKDPVNRSESMITTRMWANLAGHSSYQIVVVMTLLFYGRQFFDLGNPGHKEENSIHYTIIFNTFVWMQLFNEVNCRKLKGECKLMNSFGHILVIFVTNRIAVW
jgi:P-type Ca2+ transporter type 2B